jgi:hypothetical protein
LEYYSNNGNLPVQTQLAESKYLRIYSNGKLSSNKSDGNQNVKSIMKKFLKSLHKGDYVAIMAYVQKRDMNDKLLQKLRLILKKKFRVATTLGYGPRFLHSTGQMHKGGPDNGVFIQIIEDNSKDLAIPGKPYSFDVLKQAQALGDFEALVKHGRRVVSVNVGSDIQKGLLELIKAVS